MAPETEKAELIREHLGDKSSKILFEGRFAYGETGNEETIGMALRDYFLSAPEALRRDCPELFGVMDAAFSKGTEMSGSHSGEREKNFYAGLKAIPERFTDIYNCYFDSGIIKLGSEEVFVDAGAQDLFTSYRFAQKVRKQYRAIYAFEPSSVNFLECCANRELFDGRLFLSQTALNDREGEIGFMEDRQNSHPDQSGSTKVPSDSLDHLLADAPPPTFLKLHLEGAELAALKGAGNIISQYRPKIAVCVDHRKDDVLRIPLLLLELVPEYRFYFRHYSSSITETVLYSVL